MNHRKIIGVMATDPQGVVGKEGGLPWHYTDELKHFRKITHGHVIVMGRRTFEATPCDILKERHSIVFSRQQRKSCVNKDTEYTFVNSIEDFLAHIGQWKNQKIFMIGGAEIAHLFLEKELLAEFILTKIHQSYEGDTYLNLNLLEDWPQTVLSRTENYTIYHLKNPKGEGTCMLKPFKRIALSRASL